MWSFASEKLIWWAEVWVRKKMEEKRQSVHLIQRGSSKVEGKERRTQFSHLIELRVSAYIPPSSEMQPWKMSVSVSGGMSTSWCLSGSTSWMPCPTAALSFLFAMWVSLHFTRGAPHPLCPLRTLWSPHSPCPNLYVVWGTVQGFALPRRSLDNSAQFHGSLAILSHSSSHENLNLWLLNEHKLHVLEEGDWWQRQTGGRTSASP